MRTEHILGLSSYPSHLVLPFWPPSSGNEALHVPLWSHWPHRQQPLAHCGKQQTSGETHMWLTKPEVEGQKMGYGLPAVLRKMTPFVKCIILCSLKDEWIHRCPRRGQVLRELEKVTIDETFIHRHQTTMEYLLRKYMNFVSWARTVKFLRTYKGELTKA